MDMCADSLPHLFRGMLLLRASRGDFADFRTYRSRKIWQSVCEVAQHNRPRGRAHKEEPVPGGEDGARKD